MQNLHYQKKQQVHDAPGDTDRSTEVKQARAEIEKVIDYMLKIFEEMGCQNRDHVTPAVSLCMSKGCSSRLLCNECLTENMEHTSEHQEDIIPLKSVLDRIFLHNMDDYIVKDYKMLEVNKFYDLFWRGIKLFYKEKFDGFVEKMRTTMKFLIDGFTEIIVKTKNQLLTKFDTEMQEIKRSLEDASNVMNNFNQFNVNAVVKDILGYAANGKVTEMCNYLREAF